MRQSQCAQRSPFQPLQHCAQEFSQRTETRDDIVVRAEDDGSFDEADRQTCKQFFEVALGIDAHVRCEFVPPAARQVIDQRDVAELVPSAPVDAVRLERIAAVGAEQHDPSAGTPRRGVGTSQDAQHIADGLAVILYVFDHFVTQDQIKGQGGKREGFARRVEDVGRTRPRFDGACAVIFQPDHRPAEGREFFRVHAHAASVFEQAALDTLARRAHDHVEAADLSRAPDVGGFAAQGGFVEVTFGHGGYYILQLSRLCAKITSVWELNIESTEKWATPTFLLVIRQITEQGSSMKMTPKTPKNEFALAFNEVLEDKQLPKEIILAAIESAMVSAYRRAVNASTAQQVEAKVDPETGKVTVFAEKEVVEDIVDNRTEVLLEEARKVNPEAQLGDMALVETTPADFGRVAAQTARQVIQQRIREAERASQLEYFQRQVGEIISGVVQASNPVQGVTLGLDMKAEGIMPNNQKVPGERFKVHDRLRAVVLEVKDGPRGPQIILSRAHRNFLRRLLENEVPEIYHGIVEIRAIAREPGARAKVAVLATQPGVDAVGACVGIKGVRIQAIVRELHDEKIDIIQWDPDPVVYISKAISPARVNGVFLSENAEGNKTATVVVSEDQLSLAIGRDGQNARLAAKLTGWRIDIKSLIESTADSLQKLKGDAELAALLPNVAAMIPAIEEILAKKAENRPITPEEFSQLAQFVEHVERRTIQIKEEAARVEEEKTAAARAEIPAAAFGMKLEEAGIKEHIFNILTEAGYETVGNLMLALKADSNKVLGLAGIGPKTMQNIEEALAALTFPEPAVEPPVETATPPEVPAEAESEAVVVEVLPAAVEIQPEAAAPVEVVKEAVEEPAVKDGVSLEEMFAFKPEAFTAPAPEEESESDDKKKGKKKGKKKSVELEFDEKLGAVVARKKHKRADGVWEEE